MVSHTEAKKYKRHKEAKFNEFYIHESDLTIKGDVAKFWTETGIECENRGSLCSLCPIHQLTGMHKDATIRASKCFQADVNQMLKDKGLKKPLISELKQSCLSAGKVTPWRKKTK